VGSLGLTSLGFILGLVVVPLLLRWLALLRLTFGLHGGDFLGPPKRRLLWAVPLIFLVNPAPYFLAGAVVIAVLTIRGRISGGWGWLLLGFGASAIYMAAIIAAGTVLRVRKRGGTAGDA
jgi:hypothetical protein